jgi:hypothetical protein
MAHSLLLRRILVRHFAIAALATITTCVSVYDGAFAQAYPSRVIRIVVSFAPGGQPDTMARLFAQHLATTVGANVIDNRPGNNTIIGALANVGVGNLDHATAIGADAVVSSSNTIILGRGFKDNVIVGNRLIVQLIPDGGSLANQVCFDAAGNLLRCSSSLRYKTNVQPFRGGLDTVRKLQLLAGRLLRTYRNDPNRQAESRDAAGSASPVCGDKNSRRSNAFQR